MIQNHGSKTSGSMWSRTDIASYDGERGRWGPL